MNESTGTERPGSPWSDADVEHARVGYQTAVSLWIYEGNLIWSKYNAMLVANSIVLAVTGFAFDSNELSSMSQHALPVAGIVLCILWLQLTKRGFDHYVYWIMSARAIEEKYFPHEIKTVSRGGVFASGDPVMFTIGGQDKVVQMSRVSDSLTAAWGSYLVVACFMVLYVFLLF